MNRTKTKQIITQALLQSFLNQNELAPGVLRRILKIYFTEYRQESGETPDGRHSPRDFITIIIITIIIIYPRGRAGSSIPSGSAGCAAPCWQHAAHTERPSQSLNPLQCFKKHLYSISHS